MPAGRLSRPAGDSRPRGPDFATLVQRIVLTVAALFGLTYLLIAAVRLSYPFEIEWLEGGSVAHVQRILDGRPLYVRPSLSFVPYIYTPLYFHVSSLVARITGNGFLPLRLVSLLSSIGCFVWVFRIVRARTSSSSLSFLAAGLLAAAFRVTGYWFDLARVDTLGLFLLLAGIHAFDSARPLVHRFAAPLLVFLSFYTKQIALIPAIGLSLAAVLTRDGRDRVLFPLVLAILMIGSTVLMNRLTDGWYQFYVFDLPGQHPLEGVYFAQFWIRDIGTGLPIGFALCLVAFVPSVYPDVRARRRIRDLLTLGSLVAASLSARLHSGGFENVLMPACAGISIYFGIGAAGILKRLEGRQAARGIVTLAMLAQFLMLVYSPARQLPSLEDRAAGRRLRTVISSFTGEVYISAHPWYAGMVGKPTQAQEMAVRDILRAGARKKWQPVLEREMLGALAEGRYEAFIVDAPAFTLRAPNFSEYYAVADTNLTGNGLFPMTGGMRRPKYLFVRRQSRAGR